MRRTVLTILTVLFLMPNVARASDLAGFLASLNTAYEQFQDFTVTVTVDNTSTTGGGPLNTTNATATLTVPSGLQIGTVSAPGATCMNSATQVVCSYPTFASGQVSMIEVTLQGTMIGTHEMGLSTTHGLSDPDPSNNSDQLLVTITEPTAPELEVTKTAQPTNVSPGELITYTLEVTNTGNATATDISVQDVLPAGIDYVASSDGCVESLGVVTCTEPGLEPGTSLQYTITVVATQDGTISNSATASSAETGTTESNAAMVTVTSRADISVSKEMATRAVFQGGMQVFTITVTNNGPDTAEGVVMTDNLPNDPQSSLPVFGSPTLPADCSGTESVTCNLGSIPSGGSKVVFFSAPFHPDLFGGDPLNLPQVVDYTNTATVTASTQDDNPANNMSSVAGKVLALPGTGANKPGTESVSDPVNTFSGELHDTFAPDLFLNGPNALFFERHYAAHMAALGLVESGMGPNWSHNWAWRVSVLDAFDNDIIRVVSPRGQVFAFQESDDSGFSQLTSLHVPMQLKVNGDGWLVGDPRSGDIRAFNAEGQFTTLTTRSGADITLTWSGGELQSVSDGLGRTLSFSHTAGRLASVTDGTRSVVFSYSPEGWLTSMTDAAGQTQTMTYADGFSAPLMESLTQADGVARFTQTFDSMARVASQTDAQGGVTRFAYSGTSTTVTDPAGQVSTYTYDSDGQLTSVTDAAGTVTFTYDDSGRRTSITDRLGGEVTMAYHADSGLPTRVGHADGTATTASYAARTAAGAFVVYDRASETDESGATTTYTYDTDGNRTGESLSTGESRTSTFNARGQVLTATVSGRGTTTWTYDSAGNTATVTNPDGETSTYTHDSFGRRTGVTDPAGESRTWTYDALDRLTSTTFEDGRTRTYTYDAVGNMTSMTNEGGSTATFTYDAMDNVTTQTDFSGAEVAYTWDAVGRMASRTDRTGRTVTLTWDAAGNLASETDAAGRARSYTYDAEGTLTRITNQDGSTLDIQSDVRGRPIRFDDAESASVTLSRNAAGRITGVTGPGGTSSTISSDALGRIQQIMHPAGTVGFQRDASGAVTSVTSPLGQSISYTTDARGQRTSVTDGLGRTSAWTYDAAGRVTRATYDDGSTIDYTHNSRGALTGMTASDGTSASYTYNTENELLTAPGLSLTRNASGVPMSSNGLTAVRDAEQRIETLTLPAGDITYAYDTAGRLASVTDWAGRETTFTYDAGNRVTLLSRPNGTSTAYTYTAGGLIASMTDQVGGDVALSSIAITRDAAGRPLETVHTGMMGPDIVASETASTYDAAFQLESATFDARGRRTVDAGGTHTWDGLGRWTGTEGLQVAYDGLGMPVTVGETEWTWNYLFALPTPSVASRSGTPETYYVHTPAGELLYAVDASTGAALYYHFDELGNTRTLTNDTATPVAGWAYGPFGEPAGSWGDIEQPFTFQGQASVMTLVRGLYHMRSRVYDSATAQFLSPDPLVLLDPVHMNPYQYAAGTPTLFSDPMGQLETAVGTGLTVSGILVTTAETLEALDKVKLPLLSALNSKAGQAVIAEAADGLIKGGKLAPNVSGVISFGAETYSSGNFLRGIGVGATDVALTANPYAAVVVIASDLVDFGFGQAGLPAPKLGEIFRNAGRFVGALATDGVRAVGGLDGPNGSSLDQLASDIHGQGGIPGLLFDASASVQIYFGNEDLGAFYEAEEASRLMDIQVELANEDRLRQSRRAVRDFLNFN